MEEYGISIETEPSSFDTLTRGGTCMFWCLFSLIFGLLLASWNKGLVFYISFAIALFFIGGFIYDFQRPWHAGESCLAILFGIMGIIIGKALINKHAK